MAIADIVNQARDRISVLSIRPSGLRKLLGLVLATPPIPGWPHSCLHFSDPDLWRNSQCRFSSRAGDRFLMDWPCNGYRRYLPCEPHIGLLEECNTMGSKP